MEEFEKNGMQENVMEAASEETLMANTETESTETESTETESTETESTETEGAETVTSEIETAKKTEETLSEQADIIRAEAERKEELKKQAAEKRSNTINALAGVYLVYNGYCLFKGFIEGFKGVWDKDALIQSIFGVLFILFGIFTLYRGFGKKIIAKLKIYKKWSEEDD